MTRTFTPAAEVIRRLRRIGWLALAVGAGFGLFVLVEGGAPWSQRLLALLLFSLPFLWGGHLFLREAALLARARIDFDGRRLGWRLPRGGRLSPAGGLEEGEMAADAVRRVDYRQRPLLELIFLSALRPRGTFSRHVFVLHADGRVLELDPALWPGIETLARHFAERLSAAESAPSSS